VTQSGSIGRNLPATGPGREEVPAVRGSKLLRGSGPVSASRQETVPKAATWQDADLLMRFDDLAAREETRKAIDWFRVTQLGAEAPNPHPIMRDAPEFVFVSRFLELFETMGVLVKSGVLNEDLVHDRWMVRAFWDFLRPTLERERRTIGSATLGENFEWLAERNRGWAERRKPKVRERAVKE
jgi:hypothetical protein